MRVVIQRVISGSVSVNGGPPDTIGRGIVCLFGASAADRMEDADKLAYKTANLRIFEDSGGKMNHSAAELGLDILVVPNFTLYADTKKGLRPSFIPAAHPDFAQPAFEAFVAAIRAYSSGNVKAGVFGAAMRVDIANDGPVTVILDVDAPV